MAKLAPLFTALDLRIGFRMLKRYPWLTVVATLGIAVAIALSSIYFEAIDKWQNPRLPVRDGDRIVSILHWDVVGARTEQRLLHDFALWREQLTTVENLGAAVPFVRNLATDDGRIEPVRGAELTANAFGLLGTPPLLGRALVEQDEQPSEPPVIVLSHSMWASRFASDPAAVGRLVKLGSVSATIVGVMPERFAFPMNHRIWMPLRTDGTTLEPRTGPLVSVFGRLAPGKTIDDARAEIEVVGARMSSSSPATHEQLRPLITPYAKPLDAEFRFLRRLLDMANGVFLMLLAIVCTNVATLVFARTAMRSWEITVRGALGASRTRIVGQLFTEALLLAGIATFIGLLLATIAMRWGLATFAASDIPFWIDATLSWKTVLYAAVLMLFGAAIVGILPALRVTKLSIRDALHDEAAGLRFGGFWTMVVVVQVAITVLFLPLAAGGVFAANRFSQRAEAIGAERYLTASVGIDGEDYALDSAALAQRARRSLEELELQLNAEPGVERVAFANPLPVDDHLPWYIEVDASAGVPSTSQGVSTLVRVSSGFFAAFGTSVIAGRDFTPLDFEKSDVLIVNEAFARNVLGERNAVGQRVRIVGGDDGPVTDEFREIVGVVRDFGWQPPRPQEQSAMYRPTAPTADANMSVAVLVRDPGSFATRLRTIAAEVDPTIRLTDVQTLDKVGGGIAQANWALTAVAWLVGFVVLLLSAMGIHALMSFTVARRKREIGIRAALGARPARIVSGIFARALFQIGAGLVVGTALAALAGVGNTREVLLLVAADCIMLVVGLTACAVPVRRALRIDPTEAMKAER